ncbi:hypothetical protein IQ238_02410 [Pleurocapsales cyanobacterium LEGE 06147]|nr:hypothetical protein [Pleurocapsales cyanobacterium LEGE 06147]
MRVCVIGTGYIGLVTSAALAQLGHQVIYINENATEIEQIQLKKLLINEPELEEALHLEKGVGRLEFSSNLNVGVANSQIIFIAVDSFLLNTTKDDTSHIDRIEAIAKKIGVSISGEYKVIVNKSIPYFGIGNWIREIIDEEINKRKLEFTPEFDVIDSSGLLENNLIFNNINNAIFFTLESNNQRVNTTLKQLGYASTNYTEPTTPFPYQNQN